MGHCKVKYSLVCCVQQVLWVLHGGLQQGWAGGLWGLQFCRCVKIFRVRGSIQQPQRTEPFFQCVNGQLWAWHGTLQGHVQPLQCAPGVVGPALGALAGLGRWFVGVAVLLVGGAFQRRRQHSATTAHRALRVCVASPGNTMGHCKVKCRLCGGACDGGCSRAG